MKLTDILVEDRVKIPLENTEKTKIIEEMVTLIDGSRPLKNPKQILKAVLDRESVMSTGVGDEIAIPHGKSDGVDDIIAALGVTKEPVNFNSLDNRPVRLVWLLVGPQDKTGPHLKALSRISRLMHKKELREKLMQTTRPEDVMDVISCEENSFFEN